MARVGEAPETPVSADDRAALERAELEPVVVEDGLGLGVGERQDLEAVVEQEAVDHVGPDASADRMGALEHERAAPRRDERAGAREAGHARPDDDDVVFLRSSVRAYRAAGQPASALREARVDLGLAERESCGVEPRRRHALPAEEHLLAHLAEGRLDGERRQREDRGAVQRPAERLDELAVRERAREPSR